jgi:hypothetical protein
VESKSLIESNFFEFFQKNQTFSKEIKQMPRGGRRANAGRKKGLSPYSVKDRARALTLMTESGISPLGLCLQTAGDSSLPLSVRLQAAGLCLPFIYPKLGAVLPPLAPTYGADGRIIEGVSTPVAPSITAIHIHPVESGHYLDDPAPVRELEPIDADVPVPGPAE